MGEVRILKSALDDMLAHAAAAAPEECCGLFLGRNGLIEHSVPAVNVSADPLTRFEIDPQALVDAHRAARAGGPEILGYFHSHPGGPAAPSDTDRAQSARDGRVWAIAGVGGVTFWLDGEHGFAPLSYVVEGR
jgi:proteasome lid subunit RPN8/RPN11